MIIVEIFCFIKPTKNYIMNFFSQKVRVQSIFAIIVCLLLFFQKTTAQVDTMFIHLPSAIDYYPTNQVDSVTFQHGILNNSDSMIVWAQTISIAKYLVSEIDSISFIYNPTIYQPLITYCVGVPQFCDSRDFSVYRTVQIGNQCWLRENLRYLPAVFSPLSLSNTENKYYVYEYYGDSLSGAYNHLNYSLFGVLYNFNAAYTACPKGWKLPTDEEWDSLQNYLIIHNFNYDESNNENKIAKSLSGSSPQLNGGFWSNSNTTGAPGNTDFEWKRNLSGFSILPGGILNITGFANINMDGYFWGYSNSSDSSETSRSLFFNQYGLNNDLMPKENGLSVRCIAKPLFVQTDPVTDLTNHNVTLNGSVEFGALAPLEKGFYLRKNSQSNWIKNIVYSDSLILTLSNLDSSTTYHYFAFVSNLVETKFGDTLSFTTFNYPVCPGLPSFMDLRDSTIYNTVKIGNQCWLKENLRYLPSISNLSSSTSSPNYYVYGYNGTNIQDAKATVNYITYGALYNRIAIMNGESNSITNPSGIKGICPSGWHIPSESEFVQLTNYLGGSSIAGQKLKSTNFWNNNGNGNNSSFYTALPAGKMNVSSFINIGDGAFYWTSTKWTTDQTPRVFFLNSTSSGVYNVSYSESNGLSVRCVKNDLYMNIDSIVGVTSFNAQIYATITPGYDSVISRGIYWKSINDSQWNVIPTTGIKFNVNLSNLSAHTTYQVLCYNVDISGITLSDTIQFTTLHTIPIPKIPKILKTYNNRFIVLFEATPGTLPISSQWYRYRNIDSTTWNIIPYTGLNFVDTLNSLFSGKMYEIENGLTSLSDTFYSPIIRTMTSLYPSCPGHEVIMDDRDSNIYETIYINGICWMKENLRYLPSVVNPSTYSSSIPYYFVYGYTGTNVAEAKNTNNYLIYGSLYNFSAAINGEYGWDQSPSMLHGNCPKGWFLPSRQEWSALFSFLSSDERMHVPILSNTNIAKSVSASTNQANGGYWKNSTVEGAPGNNDFIENRNLSGFSIIPGGGINNLQFLGIGEDAYFWTSSRYFNTSVFYITNCNYNSSSISSGNMIFSTKNAASIRCVKQSKPIVISKKTNYITNSELSLHGEVIKGIDSVMSQGFLWKKVQDTIWNSIIVLGDTISYNLINLDSATAYESKAFAITLYDTIYSTSIKAYTLGSKHCPNLPFITDSRDNNIYNTVQIGNQCWLKENLRYLPKVVSNSTTSSTDTLYYVYGYNDTIVANAKLTANYNNFGVLYNRNIIGSKVCPQGWAIPSVADWDSLKTFLINNGYNYNSIYTGNKIAKSLSGSYPQSNGGFWANSSNIGVPGNSDFPFYRNKTQFSILPGGYISGGSGLGINTTAKFWSYSPYYYYDMNTFGLNYNSDSVKMEAPQTNDAFYIRCIQYNPTSFNLSVIENNPTSVKILVETNIGSVASVYKIVRYKVLDSLNWNEINGVTSTVLLNNLVSHAHYVALGYYIFYNDTIWSSPLYFRTAPAPHTFSTVMVDNIKSNSGIVKSIISKGSLPILLKGIQYQKYNSNVWISINGISDTVSILVNNLETKTYYRVRCFASDSTKTYYSNYLTFSTAWNGPCPNNPVLTDSRDGNVYETIQIGNQCWMRENLRYLPSVSSLSSISNTLPYFYVYNYNSNIVSEALATNNYQKYGTLLNWTAATNSNYYLTPVPSVIQGICPTGWHLPQKAEFDTLCQYLSNNQYSYTLSNPNYISKSMVSSYSTLTYGGLWLYDYQTGYPGNDDIFYKRNNSGFSALPGGYINSSQFYNVTKGAYFWTATPADANYTSGYLFNIYYSSSYASSSNYSSDNGASVRCVKN